MYLSIPYLSIPYLSVLIYKVVMQLHILLLHTTLLSNIVDMKKENNNTCSVNLQRIQLISNVISETKLIIHHPSDITNRGFKRYPIE